VPIFDQGYQHWSGHLSGHTWRWLAIARHGVRVGMKNRMVRLLLLISATPALALAFVLCIWGLLEQKSDWINPLKQFLSFLNPAILNDPKHFRTEIWTVCYSYFLLTELRCSMILILLVGPNLISQDLRFNALPLYFSRPLRRVDYFLGKLGVIGAFLGMMIIVPSLVAYALGLLFSLDLSIVGDTFGILLASIAYGLVIALSAGLLILALSSLSRNSRYVAMFWLAIWFISSIAGSILEGVAAEQRSNEYFRRTMMNQQAPMQHRRPGAPGGYNQQPQEFLSLQQKAFQDFQAQQLEAAKTDWRPLVSYTANLSRVGEHLLGSEKSWESLSQLLPSAGRDQFLLATTGPRYPWYWSAGVLLGLLGLSACILNFSIRSLDRLK